MPTRKQPAPPADGLLDLFGAQSVTTPRVATAEPVYGAAEANVKWLKLPATGGLCTLCIRAIHGVKDGPAPLRATARRKGPNEELLLCPAHAQDMRERDQAAEAARKARLKQERPAARTGNRQAKHREHA